MEIGRATNIIAVVAMIILCILTICGCMGLPLPLGG